MKNYVRIVIGLSTLCLVFDASLSCGATIRVPGHSPTIQGGIDLAGSGDTVLLVASLYHGSGNHDLDFGGKNLVLTSMGGSEGTVLDLNGSPGNDRRAFYFHNGEDSSAVVEGLTIRGGHIRYGGGFYIVWGASPTIRDVVIEGCYAYEHGGGLYIAGGTARIKDCVIRGCQAANSGGGLFAIAGAATVIERCTFVNDSALEGGALCFIQCAPLIRSCTIVNNNALLAGAVYILSPSLPVFDHTLVAFNNRYSIVSEHYPDGDTTFLDLSCCNIYGNVGGDWIGRLAPFLGIDGNISQDPLFCDTVSGEFFIDQLSSCAPGSTCAELIGAWPVECNYACCNHDGIRGDVDYDLDSPNVEDLNYLVAFLFTAGPEPPCFGEADSNGDSKVNIEDLVLTVAWLFAGGPAPLSCP